MGKFSNVLFSSDFDHTLSGMDGEVPQKNIDAIRYFIAEGGRFTLNSGRSIPLLRPKLGLIPVNAPCLCYNGAACYDYAAEQLFYAHPMPEFAKELVAAAQAYDPTLALEVQRIEAHYPIGDALERSAFLRRRGKISMQLDGEIPFPWMKLVVCAADPDGAFEDPNHIPAEVSARMTAMTQYLRELAAGKCYIARSMPLILEIGPFGWDKGRAARELAEKLGCKTLVCAGDAPNDLEMLQCADISFAPSDCDPEVRALADVRLTAPCGEGAVAAAIEQLDALFEA